MNNDLNTQLFNIKQKGGLLTPSRSVVKVIKTSHMLLKRILSSSQEIVYKPPKNSLSSRLINDIVHEWTPSVFPELREHELDCSPLEPHSPSLIKLIAKKFCTALLCHFCDRLSQETIGCSRLKRNQSSRLSIFKNYWWQYFFSFCVPLTVLTVEKWLIFQCACFLVIKFLSYHYLFFLFVK